MKLNRRATNFVFPLLQVGLLALATALWWSSRHNTLEGNGRWIVGKDTGKFVFQTYGFMSKPLDKNGVRLTDGAGYQELRYHKGDNESHTLTRVTLDAVIPQRSYLWLELQANGQEMLACRFSTYSDFPSTAVHFDSTGHKVKTYPALASLPNPGKHGQRTIEALRQDNEWVITIQGEPFTRIPALKVKTGNMGVRGPGTLNARTLVRNVSLHFTDRATGHVVKEHDDFSPHLTPSILLGAILFSLGCLGLRRLRGHVLAEQLAPEGRSRFIRADHIGLVLCLSPLPFLHGMDRGVHLLAGFLVAELCTVVSYSLSRKRAPATFRWTTSTTLFAVLTLLLISAASLTHGEWLGRAKRSVWMKLRQVDPSAFIQVPNTRQPSAKQSLQQPRTLEVGTPFFVEDAYFKEQHIVADFTMSSNCTIDLVFQLQSYLTRGDPNGEELPLQRRLLRLSTHPKVPMGLAIGAQTTPSPFFRVDGTLLPNQNNHLELTSSERGITILLNEQETFLKNTLPLGFGQTGFMVLDGKATLEQFTVEATSSSTHRHILVTLRGIAFPFILSLLVWMLLRLANRLTWRESLLFEFTALYGVIPYLLGTLFLDLDKLAFMGSSRLAWLDITLLTLLLAHFIHLAPRVPRLRGGPIYSNLILLASFASLALLVWDLLPAKHPLRLRFTKDAFVPGELIKSNRGREAGPWYANDRIVGANTFFWKQRLGNKLISPKKPNGVIRIFTMGGSQAWGSGAASSAETYDQLLEQKLKEKGLPVEVYNSGINGAGISKVSFFYAGLIAQFEPDIVILDVGLNDSAALRHVRSLEGKTKHLNALLADYVSLLEEAREKDVRVLLSLEAMSSETALSPNTVYYERLTQLTQEYGGTVLDAVPTIRKLEKDHFVWWDTAHYAPYGHEALSRFLLPETERLVRERLARKGQ